VPETGAVVTLPRFPRPQQVEGNQKHLFDAMVDLSSYES